MARVDFGWEEILLPCGFMRFGDVSALSGPGFSITSTEDGAESPGSLILYAVMTLLNIAPNRS